MPEDKASRITVDSNVSNNGASKLPWVILALVVLVLIIIGVLFRDRLFSSDKAGLGSTAKQEEKLSGYQAVFLTNGQVYFGKLADMSATYATLSDIYYLQVTQPGLQGNQESGQTQQSQQQLSLVKLGNELHGPVDTMKINRDQILFFEDIKEDGRVMQAIREYQKTPHNDNNTQQPTQQQQQSAPVTNTNTVPTTNTNTSNTNKR